jgi:hypothetical protein
MEENRFDFSNFFEWKYSKYPGLVHVIFVSILKRVGQNKIVRCLVGHPNEFDQSNESQSTHNMGARHYAVTLSGTRVHQLDIGRNGESLYFVYTQKGNSTEVEKYCMVSGVTWRNIIFREKK